MSLSTCPPNDHIEALVRGTLSGPDRSDLESHLSICGNCQRVADAFLSRKNVPSPTPLQRVVEMLKAGPPPAAAGERWRSMLEIGSGGMGVVHLAWDLRDFRCVAVKVLNDDLVSDERARERFKREAGALMQIKTDRVVRLIVPVLNGLFNGRRGPFIVMEHIEGESLRDRLKRKEPLPPNEAARIVREILLGLADAHAVGVIHRDIKPANVLIEKSTGAVKLIDFGLAQREGDTALTRTGAVAGTPEYLAPEQARGQPATVQTDLYAVGATLYTLAAGVPPFQGSDPLVVLSHVRDVPPVPVEQRNPSVPPRLAAIIHRLMARDPARRFASAAQAAELLAGDMDAPVLSSETLLLPDAPAWKVWLRQKVAARAKRWLRAAAVLTLAVGLVLGIWNILSEWRKPKILYVLANSFWWDDYHLPRQQLERQGFRVVVATATEGPAIPDGKGRHVWPALRLEQARADDYAAVVFCGGGHSVFVGKGPAAPEALRVIDAMQKRNGCVAAVCTGVEVLGASGVLDGVRATGNEKVSGVKLKDRGVVFLKDEPVVVEGRIVTARSGADAGAFAATIRTVVDRH